MRNFFLSLEFTTVLFVILVLNASKHIVALCGAGLSAESGVPTFRGEGGFWRTFQATELATPKAFEKNPSRVWEFYHYRRELVLTKKPNRAHKALVDFEKKVLSANPKTQTFAVITQNVDGLSSNIKNLIEMHGSLFKTRCTKCGDRTENYDSPIALALKGTENSQFDINLPIEKLPSCSKCKGLLRPDVVWFGECLDNDILMKIDVELERCDLLLVIGTSGLVYPAAAYASIVSARGGKIAVFNIEKTYDADFEFIGSCGEILGNALMVNDGEDKHEVV
ncbi:20321_t:CDS:2 [Dentiscutata erythropus]|uniref:NAD-dependent protein deacylase n=1 Tax=Dentiscutata erythropus TaxID=1348616 RepID=A0A9N9EF95_9GLOM|nr:20321_t:CDS:2 [Dentiscutata erythropus]